jgi:LPXTG-motif cell wall-anchored protein
VQEILQNEHLGARLAGPPLARPRRGDTPNATPIAILAQVRTSRWLATCMLLLGVLVLSVPAVTLASGGGGSAGDQQYTDPFAGTAPGKGKPKTTTHSAPSTSTHTAAPTTTSAPPASTPVASPSTSSDPTTPTATIASSASTAGELPHTGYDSWLAAGLGFVLVGGGLGLRVRLRRT